MNRKLLAALPAARRQKMQSRAQKQRKVRKQQIVQIQMEAI